MRKSAMLLAIITCVLCLSAGYFIGQSNRDFTVNLNPKDSITTREYTMDVYSDPDANIFGQSHVTFKLSGQTVTKGLIDE